MTDYPGRPAADRVAARTVAAAVLRERGLTWQSPALARLAPSERMNALRGKGIGLTALSLLPEPLALAILRRVRLLFYPDA